MRAALTPSPSPALRERGDLGREWGIVDSRRRRIAIAPLMPPPSARLVGAEGSRGKGEGGWGGKVRELKRRHDRPLDSRNQPTTHLYFLFKARLLA